VPRAKKGTRTVGYGKPSIDYRIVPGCFPNPVMSVGVCYTAVDAAAGGLTTEWWTVVLERFSSHPWRLTQRYIHIQLVRLVEMALSRRRRNDACGGALPTMPPAKQKKTGLKLIRVNG